jgi:hypothetical protein
MLFHFIDMTRSIHSLLKLIQAGLYTFQIDVFARVSFDNLAQWPRRQIECCEHGLIIRATGPTTNKKSPFPAPAFGGRRLHSTELKMRTTPLVPLTRYGIPSALHSLREHRTSFIACASLDSPNRGRRVACGSTAAAYKLLQQPADSHWPLKGPRCCSHGNYSLMLARSASIKRVSPSFSVDRAS